MNRDYKNQLINNAISAKYSDDSIDKAVQPMSTQRQAEVFCAEAQHHMQAMKDAVVFDPHVIGRFRRLAVLAATLALLSLFGLYAAWPALHAIDGPTVVDIAFAVIGTLGIFLSTICGWAAWRVRNRNAYPDVSAEEVRKAHALQEVVGEGHKLPPGMWMKSVLGFGNLLECAAFAFVALAGLAMLPPNIAMLAALILGVAITGAVALLGQLHAQRVVVLAGREMYRRAAHLARALKDAGDARSDKYGSYAEALRDALSDANMRQFAAPSKAKIAFLWVALASLIALALALRIAFGSALGAAGVLGALMLAVGTAVIFAANFKLAQRHMSMAGDRGKRAMSICAAFASLEAYEAAVRQHERRSELRFQRVMTTTDQCYEAKLELQDPGLPRIPLEFAIRSGGEPGADGSTVSDAAPVAAGDSSPKNAGPAKGAGPSVADARGAGDKAQDTGQMDGAAAVKPTAKEAPPADFSAGAWGFALRPSAPVQYSNGADHGAA